MPPANKARGEARIKIGDVEFVLVPSFERFAAIEEATRLGVAQIYDRLTQGAVGIAATVLRIGAESKLSRDEIGELILEHGGSVNACLPIADYIAHALVGFPRMLAALGERGACREAAGPAGDTKSGGGGPLA